MISINSIVAASHHFVRQYFRPGGVGIDATAGNGHDTLFLAELAGEQGLVHAFDIQPVALERTKALLESRGLLGRVRLHLADHVDVAKLVAPPVQAVMFNLGYLPGSNKEVKTAPANTIAALAASLSLLPGGIISVVTYSGIPAVKRRRSRFPIG